MEWESKIERRGETMNTLWMQHDDSNCIYEQVHHSRQQYKNATGQQKDSGTYTLGLELDLNVARVLVGSGKRGSGGGKESGDGGKLHVGNGSCLVVFVLEEAFDVARV